MSLKQRILEALKHKHDWKEDQWGKRCQSYGLIRTKRAEQASKRTKAIFVLGSYLVALSLLIAALVFLILNPGHVENDIIAMQSYVSFWVFGMMLISLVFLAMVHVFDKEDC